MSGLLHARAGGWSRGGRYSALPEFQPRGPRPESGSGECWFLVHVLQLCLVWRQMPLTWTQGRALRGQWSQENRPRWVLQAGCAQLLEGLAASLPRWYVQEVEGKGAGRSRLPQATPPRWRLHILSSPAKERDFWELETCQRPASPQSTFPRKTERVKGLGRTRRGTWPREHRIGS